MLSELRFVIPYQAVISVSTRNEILHKYTNSFPFLHDFYLHPKRLETRTREDMSRIRMNCIDMSVSALHNNG
jgi:hypothetical protein